jgi:hypothetical protein
MNESKRIMVGAFVVRFLWREEAEHWKRTMRRNDPFKFQIPNSKGCFVLPFNAWNFKAEGATCLSGRVLHQGGGILSIGLTNNMQGVRAKSSKKQDSARGGQRVLLQIDELQFGQTLRNKGSENAGAQAWKQ